MDYSIKDFLKITHSYAPCFSRDGRRLIYLTDIHGAPQIYEMPMAPDFCSPLGRNQNTRGDQQVLGCWLSPAVGDLRLILTRDIDGDDNTQIYMIAPNESNILHLTAGHEKCLHVFGGWSQDGGRILFSANRRNVGLFDLYTQVIGEPARLAWQNEAPGLLGCASFSPDGLRAVVVRKASRFHHELFEVDLPGNKISPLIPADENARFVGVCYSPDGGSLFLNTDLDSEFLYIARLDLATGAFESIVTADWDIENMALSKDGKRLAFTLNVEGASELQAFDLESGNSTNAPLSELGPGVVAQRDRKLAFSPFSSHLAFSFSTEQRTTDIYTWNVDENQIHRITYSPNGNLTEQTLRRGELVRLSSFDGLDIPARLYLPAAAHARPVPAILFLHGEPNAQSRPNLDFMIQYFLWCGYAVLAPNLRGSNGYGKSYGQLDDGKKRMDVLADLAHAAQWLQQQPGIDAQRLAAFGHGYGGYLALAALAHYPHLWAAGVSIAGMSNLATFLETTQEFRRAQRQNEYGSLSDLRPFLASNSPVSLADQITAPVLIVHGENDARVPIGESEQMAKALREQAAPVEFVRIEGEGHTLVNRVNRRKAYTAVAEFLETHLRA